MPRAHPVKPDRLQIRIDTLTKGKLEKAAALRHQSLGDFVLAQAIPAAEQVIAEHEKVTLSEADWNLFYDALVNPPAPNEALTAAWERFREARQAE